MKRAVTVWKTRFERLPTLKSPDVPELMRSFVHYNECTYHVPVRVPYSLPVRYQHWIFRSKTIGTDNVKCDNATTSVFFCSLRSTRMVNPAGWRNFHLTHVSFTDLNSQVVEVVLLIIIINTSTLLLLLIITSYFYYLLYYLLRIIHSPAHNYFYSIRPISDFWNYKRSTLL